MTGAGLVIKDKYIASISGGEFGCAATSRLITLTLASRLAGL